MRLLVVSATGLYPFDENGPALALYALMRGMLQVSRSGSDEISIEAIVGMPDPKYLKLDWHPILNIPIVPVLRNLKSINGFETAIDSFSMFINRIKKADIVFYNSPPTDVITFAYPFIARLARRKQVYYLHGSLVNEKVDTVTRKYFHFIAHWGFFNKVIIPLESFKSLVSKLVCPYKIIETIPECVITSWYDDSHEIPLEGDPVVLYAGRFAQVKRVDVLLKAFSIIMSRYPSARLYLAGSGPLELSLKKLCVKLKISRKVVFLGHVRHDRLRIIYRSSDIFALPSDAEFMSFSLLEAMASKCAVVATDIAATEVIENGKNGLVFPCGDFKTLANSLSILVDDKKFRKKLSDMAYLTVKEKFDHRVVASRLTKEMRNILIQSAI